MKVAGVYHSAKIRNFKQITTGCDCCFEALLVFITLQRYEILSKSQRTPLNIMYWRRCLSLCKDTKF